MRIANGKRTIQHIPWAAALSFRHINKPLRTWCTGAIISENHIITAGHCLVEKDTNNPPWDELLVVFGADDLSILDPVPVFLKGVIQIRKIKNVNFHKKYQYPEAYHDIGESYF